MGVCLNTNNNIRCSSTLDIHVLKSFSHDKLNVYFFLGILKLF